MTTGNATASTTPIQPIPDTLAQVTPAWLSRILAPRHPGVEILAAEVGDFFGHKPNKAKLKVTYNDAGRAAGLPENLIVKGGFTGRDRNGLLTGLDIGLELELLAYAELVPHLDVNTPRCFATAFDPDSHRGVMLIEELADPRASFLHRSPALSYPQAAAFLDAQARFHAQWP